MTDSESGLRNYSSLVLASNNLDKLRELRSLLIKQSGIEVCSQSDFAVQPVEETGLTFVENALLKARSASAACGMPALADDSGLCVTALNGRPGIHSARFAGPESSDEANNARLLQELSHIPPTSRTACYYCALVLIRHPEDPTPIICCATWWGEILVKPRGSNGFGYDPLFWIPELGASAAELESDVKNRISHRGQAIARLCAVLTKSRSC